MVAITKVNVGGTRFVPLDEAARTWPRKSMRGFVIDRRICFYLDDDPRAIAPNQFCADEFARTCVRITLKKPSSKHPASHISRVGTALYSVRTPQRGVPTISRLKCLPLCKRPATSVRIRPVCHPETRE